MKYFFILGSNPTLSIAELSAVLPMAGAEVKILSPEIFIIDTPATLDCEFLLPRLGGVIKIGRIIEETTDKSEKSILATIKNQLPNSFNKKFKFGFSNYSADTVGLKILGMETKRLLAERNISSRWVISREKTLSSVVVTKNKLIDQGWEIVFFSDQNKIIVGRTEAVQPFAELSFRDYGRPGRDDYSGMLPPKLAMIMINLTGLTRSVVETRNLHVSEFAPIETPRNMRGVSTDITVLDPFCGSGTILTEAMLMGYSNLIGADISTKAITDTKKNVEWIEQSYKLKVKSKKFFIKSAIKLSRFITANSVDVIVTEPYLGPPRGRFDMAKVKKELENLYSQSLLEFYQVLKPGGRVVMVWPLRQAQGRQATEQSQKFKLNVDINGFQIINPIPENLHDNKFIHLTNRDTIIYGRPGQRVWREIVVLEKAIL